MNVAALPHLSERLTRIRAIASGPAAAHADDVDRAARFPSETVAALRAEGFLAAPIARADGGWEAPLGDLSLWCGALAEACGSAAMVFAMHLIQAACLSRHGRSAALRQYVREMTTRQGLLASLTSEVGTSGDIRSSICALAAADGRFALHKEATTGSYCEEADGLLVTARRHVDAARNDQVLVLVRREDATLVPTTTWDSLGMRGTCSPGATLDASGDLGDVLTDPFAVIACETMVPYSHVLWASVWTGLASGAIARAASCVRAEAKRTPGAQPLGAARLARAAASLQALRSHVALVAAELDAIRAEERGDVLGNMSWALKLNNLKVSASEIATGIVHEALLTVGIAGYKNDSPYSIGRYYRDVLSAPLMISNDRIAASSGAMWMVFKDE